MLKNQGVEVIPPKKCPMCGEENNAPGDIYGEPYLFTIEDAVIECKWVIVKGWICEEPSQEHLAGVFGTVIRRGPMGYEDEPVDIIEPNCVYIVSKKEGHKRVPYFSDRTYHCGNKA